MVIKPNKSTASARAFFKDLYKSCPIRINNLQTANGKESANRLFASREHEPSDNHVFNQMSIEHRLTKVENAYNQWDS